MTDLSSVGRQAAALLIPPPSPWQAQSRDWRGIARPEQLPPLEDWQVAYLRGGRGAGKALALDTPLPTPTGWTTMGEVKAGDCLFDENGDPTTVLVAHDVLYYRECFRVGFDDGTSIVADRDHLWLTWIHNERKAAGRAPRAWRPNETVASMRARPSPQPKVRTTAEIAATLKLPRKDGQNWHNHSIPCAKPLHVPHSRIKIGWYTFGAWLGDGTSNCGAITVHDNNDSVLDEIRGEGYAVKEWPSQRTESGCSAYHIGERHLGSDGDRHQGSSRRFATILRRMGVLHNKHVPAVFFRGSTTQRLALLQGLMDTDGNVATGRNGVEFVNTNKPIADAVYELAISLGEKATRDQRPAMLNGVAYGTAYRVRWRPHVPPFRMPRKAAAITYNVGRATDTSHRSVISVEPVESTPVRCVTVDSPSHLYLAGPSMIPTHNTWTAARWLAEMIAEHDRTGAEWGVIGPTFGDAVGTCIEGPSGLLNALGTNRAEVDNGGSGIIRSWNRSEGVLVFRTGGTLFCTGADTGAPRVQGKNLSGCWCDEIGLWLQWQIAWEESIGFALRIRPARIIATGTPKRRLPARALVKRLISGDGAWPKADVQRQLRTDDNLANLDPSFVTRVVDPARGTASEAQELLGDLLEEGGTVFDPSRMRRLLDVPDLTGARLCRGWDLAATDAKKSKGDPDWTAGALVALLADRSWCVLDMTRFRLDPGESRGRVAACRDADLALAATFTGCTLTTRLEVERGAAGRNLLASWAVDLFHGLTFGGDPVSGSKVVRAEPVAAAVATGQVSVVQGPWAQALMDEVELFPDGRHDDQVDALTLAFNFLAGVSLSSGDPILVTRAPATSVGSHTVW